MKRALTILVAISFVGITAFGFLAMGSHEAGHGFSGCIAALQGKTNCSVFEGLVDFASFHLNILKVFSSIDPIAAAAKFDLAATGLLFLTGAFFLSAVLTRKSFDFIAAKSGLAVAVYSLDYGYRTSFEKKFTEWLALHGMRDPAFSI